MATQLADTADTELAPIVETGAEVADNDAGEPQERDYEAEARQHGWTPEGEFKGDPKKWVDAETFAKRADEVMPFLKKQNTALKREMDDLKRTMKQASAFYSKAEERAYQRALADLEAKHDEAVEAGDTKAARAVVKELTELEKPVVPADDKPAPADVETARMQIAEWVERTEWYGPDAARTKYADDVLVPLLGNSMEYPGGTPAYLAEIGKRVDRKFADPKPNPVNGGGNRPGAANGAKTFADLPAEAKAACDRFHRSGVYGEKTLVEARAQYVKDYDFGS